MVQKSQVSQLGGGYAAPAGAGGGTGPQSGRKTPVFKSDRPDEHFAAHCRSFTAHVNVSFHTKFYFKILSTPISMIHATCDFFKKYDVEFLHCGL